ncbi:MAG TPA: class I SAM-dependent methyltransferase [Microthrixaceae bacterium]|nr:class I SAM-dependent methyltransferase [Microthrixaceae bacterium]
MADIPRNVIQSKSEKTAFLQSRKHHAGSFVERGERIRRYVERRRVLDLGCASAFGRPDWMHAQLVDMATDVLGVDLDPDAVETIRSAGFNVVQGDVEDLHLDQKFDVVFAGELIEHLERFPEFFDSVRRHLVPDGKLVLTTPNPFALSNFVYRLSKDVWVNSDHTCWFCEHTLPVMAERNGFVVDEITYVGHPTPGRIRAAAANGVRALLPQRLRWGTMMAVAHPE